jgi:hypothetical protein
MSEEHRSDDTEASEVKSAASDAASDSKDGARETGEAEASEKEDDPPAKSESPKSEPPKSESPKSEPKSESAPSVKPPRTSTPPHSVAPRGSLPPDDEYYEDEEVSTAWKVGLWILCVLFGLAMIAWGGAAIYASVLEMKKGYSFSLLRFVVQLGQVVGGAAILLPRFRFPGSLVIAVASLINMVALRPAAIPGRSWFYMNAMLIVLAGVIALKTVPAQLAARFRKDDEDEPPPVF